MAAACNVAALAPSPPCGEKDCVEAAGEIIVRALFPSVSFFLSTGEVCRSAFAELELASS
jgi:hypothetical protein